MIWKRVATTIWKLITKRKSLEWLLKSSKLSMTLRIKTLNLKGKSKNSINFCKKPKNSIKISFVVKAKDKKIF